MKILNEHIKEGRFKQLYLITGEEDYLRRQYKERMKAAITGDDDMNYSYYEGKGTDIKEVIDVCDTMPFFAERRLVVMENTGYFKSSNDMVTEYLRNMPDYLIVIFVETEVDKRNRLYKLVSEKGYISDMTFQSEAMLNKWVTGLFASENKKIEPRATALLLSKTGCEMDSIKSEVEKLVCYGYERDTITAEDVEAVCVSNTANKIFDMVTAISNRNQKAALDLYYDLLTLKEPSMRILFLISRQFNMLLQAKELKNAGYDTGGIAKKMGIKEFIAGKYVTQAKGFSTEEIKQAIKDCVESEEAVKTGQLNDVLCVELIIVKYSAKNTEKNDER